MAEYFTCPYCGADVPAKALACPACGSDDETGWSEEAKYVHLLPDRSEEAEQDRPRSGMLQTVGLSVIAVVMVTAILMGQGLTWSLYVVPLVALIAGLAHYLTRQRGGKPRTFSLPWGEEARLYRQLLERCRGDRERAERLIEYERERTHRGDRALAIHKALYRFERDSR